VAPWTASDIGFYLLWFASVSFLFAAATYFIFCPRFIKQYGSYSDFDAYGHSHRWIVWEFFNNISEPQRWDSIIYELRFKGFLCQIDNTKLPDAPLSQINNAFSPNYQKIFNQSLYVTLINRTNNLFAKSKMSIEDRVLSKSGWVWRQNIGMCKDYAKSPMKIYAPQNVGINIMLPISAPNRPREVLYIDGKAADTKFNDKELFWILFTEAARLHVKARSFFWVAITCALLGYLAGIFLKLFEVFF